MSGLVASMCEALELLRVGVPSPSAREVEEEVSGWVAAVGVAAATSAEVPPFPSAMVRGSVEVAPDQVRVVPRAEPVSEGHQGGAVPVLGYPFIGTFAPDRFHYLA